MIRKRLEIREHAAGVYHIQYFDGFLYSSSADRFLTRWDPELGVHDKFAIRFEQSVYQFIIHNQILLAGTASGDLHFFDLKDRKEIRHFTTHTSAVFSMEMDATRDLVYVGDADGNLSVWRWSDQKFLAEFPMECGKIRTICIHNDRLYLGGADGYIYVLDADKLNLLDRFYAHNEGVTAITVINDKIYSGGKDAFIRSWDLTLQKEQAIPAHNFAIYKLLPWNNLLLSVSRDKMIKAFTTELQPVFRIAAKDGGHSHSVNSACIIDDRQFATCGDDRRIIFWKQD